MFLDAEKTRLLNMIVQHHEEHVGCDVKLRTTRVSGFSVYVPRQWLNLKKLSNRHFAGIPRHTTSKWRLELSQELLTLLLVLSQHFHEKMEDKYKNKNKNEEKYI